MGDTFCHDCSALVDPNPSENRDLFRIAWVKFRVPLCNSCYRQRRKSGANVTQKTTCGNCGVTFPRPVDGQARCQNCRVAERVGADWFECDCGDRVPIHESVRLLRKSSSKIERVCIKCSQDGACAKDKHAIVTSQHKDWQESRWTFQPAPESLQRGVCSRCDVQMHWDGQEWRRMTWTVLADFWEKTDA